MITPPGYGSRTCELEGRRAGEGEELVESLKEDRGFNTSSQMDCC